MRGKRTEVIHFASCNKQHVYWFLSDKVKARESREKMWCHIHNSAVSQLKLALACRMISECLMFTLALSAGLVMFGFTSCQLPVCV